MALTSGYVGYNSSVMAETQRKTTRSKDSAEIYYETYTQLGEKPRLLFVHGVGGDLDAWQFVLGPLLAAGYSAAALDVRGSGYSGHPRNARSYTLERMNDDILSLIEAEGLGTVDLVGHSGGAVIALAFALAHPDKVARLILIAPSYAPPRYGGSPLLRALYAPFIALFSLISPPAPGAWHSPYPPGKHHKEVELYGLVRTMYHNSLASYLRISQMLIRVNFEPQLKDIRMPTLLIAAEKDGIYPLRVAQVMSKKIPDAKLVVVAGANHVLPLNRPADVVEAVEAFIKI